MATEMSCTRLLLLWCVLASSTWYTGLTRSAEEPADDIEEIETTFKHLCEGIEDELKTCNKRLIEKTEFSSKVENDLFILKRQLRQIRVTCKDAAQTSSIQISGFQAQLDSLLKQFGEKTEGPVKAVLGSLQKYVNMKKLEMEISMETDTEKIKEKGTQLKKMKEELHNAVTDLSRAKKCQTGGSSEFAEINALQEEINRVLTASNGSGRSSQIAKLQKQLEEKLKVLEKNDDPMSTQVTQLIRQQEEVLDIERSLAELQKTQAERNALKKHLEEEIAKLSKLKEEKEKEKVSPDKITDEEISTVEREVETLGENLDALTNTLSGRQDLEIKQLEKKKKMEELLSHLQKTGHELVSKILALQFQLHKTQIRAQGEKKAADFQIADLQKQLSMKEKHIYELIAQRQDLEGKKAEYCEDLSNAYEEIILVIEKMPEGNMKLILEIVSLSIEIDSINTNNKDLTEEQKDKINQFSSKKQELYESNSSADKIMDIVTKMEKIRKLQNQDGDVDKVKVEEEDLLKLISQLKDSNPAKILLRNMVMLSDATWLKKRISVLKEQTQAQIQELQEKVSKNEELLKNKLTELAKAHSNVEQLTREIASLQEENKGLKKNMKDLELFLVKRLEDLEKKLTETKQELEKGNNILKQKDIELATQVNKATALIEHLKQVKEEARKKDQETSARISDLEAKLKQKDEEKSELLSEKKKLQQELKEAKECAELKKSQAELQANFQNTVSKLNNSLAQQVFTVQTLTQEVETLGKKINSSEGNVDALKQQLRKKNAELEKVKKEVKKSKAEYAQLLQILEDMRKVSRQQEQSIKEYLEQINRLDQDAEDLMAKLAATGDMNAQHTIEVIFLKEELAKLEKLQADLKEETSEKTADLEKQIAEKNKEISYLKKSSCGTEQFKKQISRLQQEVVSKERQLAQLKKTSSAQMAEVQKLFAKKTQKLQASEAKLKEKDSLNADLISRLTELSKQLTEASRGKEAIKQSLQRQISDLKMQVKDQEKKVSELQNKNRDVLEQNKHLSHQLKMAEAKLKQLEGGVIKPNTNVIVVSPALDPDTAHSKLLLYEGNTMVKVSKIPRVVPDNHKRYDTALAALGDTGYESGRQYWEVQVGRRSCFVVGVAKESAQRKGEITYGPKHGYWAIVRKRDGNYLALTNTPVILDIQRKLFVIGVLLDFNRGEISFYDAKIKTPIYTFTENVFTEPLYPYIATCGTQTGGESPIVFLPSSSALWLMGN